MMSIGATTAGSAKKPCLGRMEEAGAERQDTNDQDRADARQEPGLPAPISTAPEGDGSQEEKGDDPVLRTKEEPEDLCRDEEEAVHGSL